VFAEKGRSETGKLAIAIVVTAVVCLALSAIGFSCCFFKRKRWEQGECEYILLLNWQHGFRTLELVSYMFRCSLNRIYIFVPIASSSVHKTQADIKTIESLQFDFTTIREATNNFSDENKLGQGGFGAVYKVHEVSYCSFQQFSVRVFGKKTYSYQICFSNIQVF